MRKKIFITGGTGFIGREVVRTFAQTKKYKLVVLTRQEIASNNENVEFVKGDILNKYSFQDHIKNSDIVLHIAGLSSGNDKMIKKVNVEGTKNIVDLSSGKKFIFISSENVLYSNQGAYGESKKICENMVKKIDDYLILRVSVVYGSGDKTRLGNVINWCKRWPIIFIPGNGKGLMQPIFVDDVALFVLNALEKDKKGVFILAGKSKVSLDEFITHVNKTMKKNVWKIHIPLYFLYSFVKLNEYILKNPFVRWYQLKNLNDKRVYDISRTIQEFEYVPLSVQEGLKKILGDFYEENS